MARILALTVATPGHLFPFVPIVHALSAAGHCVGLELAGDATAAGEVAGIPTRQHPRPTTYASRGAGADLQERAFAAEGAPTAQILDDLIASEKPDFLLIDPMLWGAMIAAEASALPWASVSHNPMTIRPKGMDLRGPGLRPPRGTLEKVRYRIVATAMREANAKYLPVVNGVRNSKGLRDWAHPWDMFRSPPLTIATTAPPFEYPRPDWSSSIRFIGPVFWEPNIAAPAWLDDLDDRPLVLVVGSSIPEHGPARDWAQLALRALSCEPYQVLATLPTDAIGSIPTNARVERFVPHMHLLPRAACVVCHGGPGITQKALAAGVPVVAIPYAYDRFEIARRVDEAEAGVALPGKALTAASLRTAVSTAIERKPGAERIAAAFRSAGGAPVAVAAISQLLEQWNERSQPVRRRTGSDSSDLA